MDDPVPTQRLEIQRADPGARRRALGLLGVLLPFLAAALWIGLATAERWRTLDCGAATREFCARRGWVYAFFALVAAPIPAFAWWLGRLARRVRASGRFPPPGMAVVRDTPVLRGTAARALAGLAAVLAALLALAALGLVGLAWRLVALFAARACG